MNPLARPSSRDRQTIDSRVQAAEPKASAGASCDEAIGALTSEVFSSRVIAATSLPVFAQSSAQLSCYLSSRSILRSRSLFPPV